MQVELARRERFNPITVDRVGREVPGTDERARPFSSREGRTAGPERPLARRSGEGLATQAQALNQCTVTLDVDLLEVTQEATTLADEEQQATTRVVVVLVHLAVLGEVE